MAFRNKIYLIASAFLLAVTLNAYANPEGESVAAGNATFDRSTPNTLTVNTASNNTIINYNSFNIAGNETTRFNQPGSDSAVLNRVTGVNPSEIYGTLSSNGKLFLVNPNGIIFGAGSSVNAPAIVASTLDIANEDFLRGSYNFFKNGESAFIINHGRLASQPGGFIALLSQSVNNQGVIIADLGTVVLASGEKMTLALDSLDQISVVIDDAVKAEVLGPDGLKMDSAIKNSGTIQANGGKVILTAKILNNVFDYAVNNSGVIQAGSIQEHDGVIELTVEGAPVVNTGSMTANSINIKVSNADFLNKGSLIANLASGLATGNITINAENILQAGSVTADNEITFTATQNINTDPAVNSDPAVIIQGKRVNLSGRQFGTTTAPLNIKADNIDLSRIQGDISILDSLGIGTSIMLRGPPDGFGAIIYNPDTNLTLEAPQGAINIFSGVILSADNLTLIAKEGITSQGLLLTDHTLSLLSEGPITSLGTLKTDTLIENGASFKVGGIFEVGTAYLENTDHAIIYAADTSVSGAISDAADIVINANISLTLGGDTTFTAGADFIMYGGSFILGGSHNLGITANRVKLLGTIGTSGSPVNNLTITGRPINSSDNNSIQTAINAIGTVSGTSTINVAAGAYNENPIISKSLSLLGPNSGINPNIGSRLAEAVITGQITINHSGVTVNGFTVTNPSGTMGIYVNGVSNISLQNNILTNIGTTFAGSSAVQAVYIYRGSTDISNISIQNSQFTNIGSGNNSSSNKAIFVGDTTSSSVKISNVTIDGNSISGVFAKTTSKGAYGILVNHLAPDIQITNNTIDNLDGLWAHAIGLEGDTPNAVVTGNAISNVVSHNPVVTDGVGVFFETNPSLGTVTVQNNSFATSVNFGVAIHPVLLAAYPGLIVNASGNWWGTNDAAAVAARVSSNVDYTPWLNSGVNSSTGTGFQGDFSVLNVSAASPQAGSIERIQEGINFVNAGGRVNVAAGTYTLGSAIAINKSDLKIWGAQANIDPRPSVGGRTGDETILKSSGTVFDIQANDAEINGFTIESSINNSSLNIVQEVSESFSSKNAKVLYNIIYNTNYPTGAMNEAVKIRTGENARIAYNYIYNIPTPGDGINFDRVTNGTIEYNELKNQGSENAAIYVYGSQNTNIIGNLVYNITQNDGIKLGSKDGSDAAKSGGNIRYNIVHDVAQDGITVYMGNTVVEGNEVYNSTSENGAVYVSFNVNNVSLINNYIHNNGNLSDARTTYGIRIGKSGYYPTNVVIFGNSIENNEAGIYYNNTGASVVLDASGNWWGTTDQATISSLANSGVKVDYTPWLNSGTDTTPLTPGFQGDFSTLNVSAASPQAGATGRIQEGINLVTAAGTVNVTAGTYPEQVTIQKSLSLIGAGEATTIIQAPAVRTGTVTQGATIHDYILAAYAPSSTIDVRVEGFTFDANSQNKIPGTDQLDGVFFRDVKDAGGTLAGLFSSTIHNFAATPDYEGFGIVVYGDSLLTLNNNNISDYTRDGISINRYGGLGSNPNVTISGNTITGSAAPLNGISISGVTSGAVTGNTVTGNTRSAPWAGGGIVLWGSTGVTITGNHVNGNFYGIDLEPGTSGVTISGNELTGNIKRAISLNGANNNTVSSNLITGPGAGTDDIAIALANTSTGNMIGGLTPADGNTITMATSGIGNLYAIHVQGDVGAGSNTIQYNTINGGKRGIQIDGGVTGTTTIVHNTIGSTTAPSFAGIVGAGGTLMITDNTLINAPHPIKLEDADGPGPAAPPTNVSILRNTITGSDFTAIEIACQISGTTKEISNNTISGVSAANFGDGIDIYNPLNWDVPGQNTGFTISGNEISGGTAYFAAMWLDIANSTISGNNIHDNAQGIMLQDGTGNTIENNTITNTRNAGAGAIGGGIILYGTDRNNVHPGTVYGSKNNTIRKNTITGGDIGINVTDLSDANTITENFITGNAIGLQAKTLNVGRDPSGTTLYDNDISGNTTAVNNLSANLIDASANWWGSANATTVAAAAGVSVDYTPWLNSGSDITPLIAGFQGDFSVLNVSAASPQAGATGIIQEGLNLVTSGGTVNVTAGTYNETFTVNKSLELRGAKYGIDARTRDTAGETIIDTPLNGVIYLSANNIIMDGFTIESDTGSGRVEPNGNNLQFLNNITERTVYPRGNPSNMTFRYNLFRDTASTQTIYGTGLYFEPSSASGSRVEDNKFMDLLYSAIILAGDSTPYTNTTISNNEIYRTQFQGINIAGNQSGLTISNNYIEQANLLHGADRGGIRLYGSAFSGTVNITNNTVNNSYNGIAIKDGQNITGKDIHVNYNNLINNSNAGVYNGGIGILDATKNYWGNATGPYNATTNASGSGNAVSDNVDYSPWWGANYIGVAHPWVWYVNQSNGSTIQEGINTATAGDTVNVTAGTYNENINIDKALTLTSPSVLVANNPILQGAGAGTTGITVSSDNVTISHLTIRGYETAIDVAGAYTHLAIENNYFNSNSKYHLRVPVGFDGATVYNIYRNSGNTADDVGVITDDSNRVIEKPAGYRVIWAKLQDAISNNPGGAGNNLDLFHQGDLDLSTTPINTNGGNLNITNKGLLTLGNTNTGSGSINITVNGDPDLLINGTIDSGGGNIDYNVTGYIWQTPTGIILTHGGYYNAIAGNYYKMEALSRIDTTGGAGVGTVTLQADTMDLVGAITTGTNSVTLKQNTNNYPINLGTDGVAGSLCLTNAELNTITAGTLIIGDDNSGSITISNDINPAGAGALSIKAGNNPITFTAHPVTSPNLTLTGSTLTNLDLATLVISGALVVKPSLTNSTIGLAGGAGTFNLDASEIAVLRNSGATSITIGATGGTGALALGADVDLPGKTVTLNSGRINSSTRAIVADTLTLNLSSSTGANTVRTTVTNLAVDTTGGTSANRGITLTDTSDGLILNIINAGAGAVSIDVGNNPIGFTANTITSGNLTLTGSTLTNLDLATLVTPGALVVKPSLTNSTIGLAGGAGDFNLNALEIAVLKASGATSITIGATGGTGAVTLGGDVDLAGKTFTLNSGTIDDILHTIIANGLTLKLASSTGGNTVKTNVTLLAADTTLGSGVGKDLSVTETDAIALGVIKLNTGTFSLTAGGNITQTGALTGNTLNLINTAGATILNNAANAISNLGTINSTGGNLSLTNTTSLIINGAFNAADKNVTINNGNNEITFTANTITSGDLTLTGSTLTNLDLATLVTPGALVVKPSLTNSTIGLAGGAGDFNLNALEIAVLKASGATSITIGATGGTGAVTLGGDVDLAGKTFTLNSGTIDDILHTIIANGLTLKLSSAVANVVNTNVTSLAATTAGANRNLTINETNAIILGVINVGTGVFSLTAGGDITQTGILTAGTLNLNNTVGATTLNQANKITNLGTINSTGGALTIVNNAALTIGGVITATGQSVDINTGANIITFNAGATNVTAGALTLTAGDIDGIDQIGTLSSSSLTLKPNTVAGTIGLADGLGTFTLTTADIAKLQANPTGVITIGRSGQTGGLALGGDVNLTGKTLTINSGLINDLVNKIIADNLSLNTTVTAGVIANTVKTDVATLNVNTSAGNNATRRSITVEEADNIVLGTVNVGSGAFTLTAGGDISQTGTLTVGGTSSFTTNADDKTIILDNPANALTGAVTFTTQTAGANLGNVLIDNGITNLNLGASTIRGNLTATTGGTISQSGAITVSGNASFTTDVADKTITLNNGANAITGVVSFSTLGTAGNVTFNNGVTALTLGTSTINGTLGLTVANTIGQSGPLAVTGATTLAAGAGNDITLNLANDFSTVAITSGNDVILNDINALILGASTVSGTLGVTTNGAITQSGVLAVTGVTTLAAGVGNDITLNNAGNNFSTVVITSGNNVSLRDANALILGASTISGTLGVTTNGAITQSGALAVTGATTLAAGAGNDITLNLANDFSTVGITSGRNVTLNDINALILGASTISGTFNLTTNGAITQSGPLAITGVATLAAGAGNDITLGLANNFSTVAITSGQDVTLNDINALILGASTISGTLGVTTNGAITQSGALAVAGATTLASGAANNITLGLANDFSTVIISNGRNVTLNDINALILGASTISGTLGVTTNGAITQSGALAVAGVATLAVGAGNDIILTDPANDFSTVAITNGNNVSLRDANALILGASTVSGTLDVTTNGAITQSGVLAVTGTATLAAGSTNNITLNTAGNNFSTVVITSGNNVSLRDANALILGASTISGTLGVTTNGAITQSGVLAVTGATTLAAGAGNDITLNLANDFSTVGITSGRNVTLNDINALILGASTVSGILDVTTSGSITQSGAVTANTFTANLSTGSIDLGTFANNITNLGAITAPGGFTLTNGNNSLTVLAAINTSGSNGPISINVGTGGFTSNAGGTLASGNGAISITADSIALGNTITGHSTLVLQPTTVNRSIGIGNGAAGSFNLNSAEITLLVNGFSLITIGRADGTGAIDIRTITFNDPVTIRAPNLPGSITVNGQITGADNASITLDGSGATTTLNANIITAGNPIIISDSVLLGTPATLTLDTTNSGGTPAGVGITIEGTINNTGAASGIVLQAGTAGTVDLEGAVGNTAPPASLTITANTININGGSVITTGVQQYNGNVVLGGDTIFNASSLIVGASTIFDPNGHLITGSGILDVFGTLLVDAATFAGNYTGFGTYTLRANSTVNYSRLGGQTIDSTFTYYNLVTSGSGIKAIDGNTSVTNLTVNSPTTFNPNGHLVTGSGTLDVFGTLLIDAPTFAGNYTGFGTRTLETNSTVNYSRLGVQTIDNTLTYYNFVTSGSGTKTFGGDINVFNATVGAGTTIDPAGHTMISSLGIADIFGTLLVDASTFDGNYTGFAGGALEIGSTVNYKAAGDQLIADMDDYYNLVISGTDTKTLAGDIGVVNATVGAGTIIDPDGYLMTGSGTLDVFGTLLVDAATFAGNYTGFGTRTLETNSTVNYSRLGAQTIDSTLTYYNLETSGSGNKTLGGDTSVGRDLTVGAGTNLNGGHTLNVTGNAVFNGTVGVGVPLTSLYIGGTTDINGDSAATTGTQQYHGIVTLGADTTLTGAGITFDNLLDSDALLARTLLINDSATTTFTGAVGSIHLLSSLTTDGPGSTHIGANINTSGGTMIFNDPVVLTADVILTDTGATGITFNSTVDSDALPTPRALTLNALNPLAKVVFNDEVGGGIPLASLDVNSSEIDISGGYVRTNSYQNYNGPVVLGGAVDPITLTGTDISFNNTLDGNYNLDIEGNAIFNGEVGGSDSLASLYVNGSTDINTDWIVTDDTQEYDGPVTLLTDTELDADTVIFGSTLDGNYNLDIEANAVFNGEVGDSDPLDSLYVNGTTEINGGLVETDNTQEYSGAVTLADDTDLYASQVTFDSTLDSNAGNNWDLNIYADAVFGGIVGWNDTLNNLYVNGTTDINGSSVETDNQQTYNGPVVLGNTTDLTGTDISFNNTVDGPFNLTLASNGATNFNQAVGNTSFIGTGTGAALTINSSGTTTFNGTLNTASGITQANGAGLIVFKEDVSVGAGDTASIFNANVRLSGMTFTANNAVTFGNSSADDLRLFTDDVTIRTLGGAGSTLTVNSRVNGDNDLTLDTTGAAIFNAQVGDGTPIGDGTGAAIIINSTGPTTFVRNLTTASGIVQGIGAGDITFRRDVTVNGGDTANTFNENVILDGLTFTSDQDITFGSSTADQLTLSTSAVTIDTSSNNANVTFNSKIDGNQDLTVNSGTGTTTFNGIVGGVTPLASITTDAPGTTNIGADMSTQGGTMTFNDPVVLTANIILTDTGATGINFNNTVDSDAVLTPRSLTINDSSATILNGIVGGNAPLLNLTINTASTLNLANNITATGIVTLNPSSGGVTQSAGSLIADKLLLLGTGIFTLNQATNNVNILAANITGPLTYADADVLTVGTVITSTGTTAGITTGGNDVILNTGNTLTIANDIDAGTGTVTLNPTAGGATETTGKILAANLLLTGGGTFTLNNAFNNVDILAANITGLLTYQDTDALTIGSVSGTDGVITGGNDVTIKSGALTLDKGITATGATVTLDAAGITQSSPVIADNLLLKGTGTFNLDNISNNVAIIAADVTGALTYKDVDSLTVGTVGPTNGITTNLGNITINALHGFLTIAKSISAVGGSIILGTAEAAEITPADLSLGADLTALTSITLNSADAITRTAGTITADSLDLTADSGIGTLASPLDSQVNSLNALNNTSGDIALTNNGDLSADSVVNTNGDIYLTVNSNLTVGSIQGQTVNLTANSGSILDDSDETNKITADTANLTAHNDIGANTLTGDIDIDSGDINAQAGGNIYIESLGPTSFNTISGNEINLLSAGTTFLNNITGVGAVIIKVTSGDIQFTGTVKSTGSGADITADTGSIFALGAGPHLITNADTFLSVPNGTITVIGSHLNVTLNSGFLVLNIGGAVGGVSGRLDGSVPSLSNILFIPSSFPSPLYPPGRVYFNGIFIWPSASAFANSQSNTLLGRYTIPVNFQSFVINTADTRLALFYQPLTELDASAFDAAMGVGADAYEFMGNSLNLLGHEGLLPVFDDIKKKNKKK